jgi:hypothetical protein
LGERDEVEIMKIFSDMVKRHFDFLVVHGYCLKIPSNNIVQYWSPQTVIELNYSDRGEIDLILDQNPPKHRFQLRLFLMEAYPELEKQLGECIASNADEMDTILSKLSSTFQQCGKKLIVGDRILFDHMATVKWWELPGYTMERKHVSLIQCGVNENEAHKRQANYGQSSLL